MKIRTSSMKWIRITALMLALGALAVLALVAPRGARANGDNAIANGDFESGATGWACKLCTVSTGTPAEAGAAAQLKTIKSTGRAQFLQNNISLLPNTTYELRFWARSASGADLEVTLLQQGAPRANYGLDKQKFDLTANGQVFTHTFTTTGFGTAVSDARLRFYAAKGRGITYSIDSISLISTGTPPPPPPDDNLSDEILVFNRGSNTVPFVITQALSGFIMDQPPTGPANANWVTGPYAGFADGMLYYRARIHYIPMDQRGMKLGFCFWEDGYDNEECRGQVIDGVAGTEMTWEHELNDMWVKSPINWANPRTKHGFLVRNQQNQPVSAKKGWAWNGEDPLDWYPMHLHYTVVLVKDGGEFNGWENYGW